MKKFDNERTTYQYLYICIEINKNDKVVQHKFALAGTEKITFI